MKLRIQRETRSTGTVRYHVQQQYLWFFWGTVSEGSAFLKCDQIYDNYDSAVGYADDKFEAHLADRKVAADARHERRSKRKFKTIWTRP